MAYTRCDHSPHYKDHACTDRVLLNGAILNAGRFSPHASMDTVTHQRGLQQNVDDAHGAAGLGRQTLP